MALYADLRTSRRSTTPAGRGRAALVVGRLRALPARGARRPELRRRRPRRPPPRALEALASADPEALVSELRRADPETLRRIDIANPRRVVRALEAPRRRELGRARGPARGELWSERDTRHPSRLFCLDVDRDRPASARRACASMTCCAAACWPRWRRCRGRCRARCAQAIGVREMLARARRRARASTQARTRMKARTRGLVRRQLTWMRKLNADIIPTSARPPESVARAIAPATAATGLDARRVRP